MTAPCCAARSIIAAVALATAPAGDASARGDSTATRRLELNLPATRLHLWRGETLEARFPVAIGDRVFPTPIGSFAIISIEWNPWWIPPPSDWAKGREPEPPGPTNPMGRVKLNFRPLYFLHGTPAEESIGHASSHGCVRLHNADAVRLAITLMHAAAAVDSTEALRAAADPVATSSWLLDPAVPLEIGYRTVEVLADTLWLHPDPYRKATPASERAAIDSLLAGVAHSLAPSTLDSLVGSARIRSVAVPLRLEPNREGSFKRGYRTLVTPTGRLPVPSIRSRINHAKSHHNPSAPGSEPPHVQPSARNRELP